MTEFFNLLLPWREATNDQISDGFVYIIGTAFLIFGFYFFVRTFLRRRLINGLTREVRKYDRPAQPQNLEELKEKFSGKGELAEAWQEFEDSLITHTKHDGDQETVVYKTDEASLFFSEDRLLGQHLNLRYWNSVPALLVGLGILGTFIGLVWGLIPFSDIDFKETNQIQEAIKKLLSGVSTAFVTSVWGMLTSLLFNGLEKWRISRVNRAIASLQRALDRLFTLKIAEEIAYQQQIELEQQTAALKSFSTDLADRIKIAMDNIMSERLENLHQGLTQLHNQNAQGRQEIIQELHNAPEAFSNAMAEQLAPSLNNLNTAVKELREQKEESSTDAIRQLVEEFQKSLSGSATAQMETLAETVSKMSEGLITLPDQMTRMIGSVQEQIDQTRGLLASTSEEQTGQMKNMMNGMLNAFQSAIDTQQSGLSQTTDRVNEEMRQIATDIRNLLESVASRTDEQLAQRIADIETVSNQSIQTLQTVIDTQQSGLSETTDRVNEEMRQIATDIRNLLESAANRTDEQLAQRMADIETVSNQSIQTLQTTIAELQQSITSTASQAATESAAMTDQMRKRFEQTATRLGESVEDVEQSVSRLLQQQGEQTEATNAQLNHWQDTLTKGREMLQGMNTSVTSVRQLIETTQAFSRQLITGATQLESAGQQLTQASDAFNQENEKYLTANRETTGQIQNALGQSQQLLNDFAKRFQTIDAGLNSIFSEIQKGLSSYSTNTRESINTYLKEFSDQSAQASASLFNSVAAFNESVDILTEMIERLTRRQGNR